MSTRMHAKEHAGSMHAPSTRSGSRCHNLSRGRLHITQLWMEAPLNTLLFCAVKWYPSVIIWLQFLPLKRHLIVTGKKSKENKRFCLSGDTGSLVPRIPGQVQLRKILFPLSQGTSLPSAHLLWISIKLGVSVETEGKCCLPNPFPGFYDENSYFSNYLKPHGDRLQC